MNQPVEGTLQPAGDHCLSGARAAVRNHRGLYIRASPVTATRLTVSATSACPGIRRKRREKREACHLKPLLYNTFMWYLFFFVYCWFMLILLKQGSSRWLPGQEPQASEHQKSSLSVPAKEQVGLPVNDYWRMMYRHFHSSLIAPLV